MNDKEKFRDQLLSQEKTNPDYQKNFQLEVKKMYTEKLKISQRIAYVLIGGVIGLFTLFFWLFSKAFEELQLKHGLGHTEPLRLVATWGMYLGVILIILSLWPAFRGKISLRVYPKAVRLIACLLILTVALLSFAVIGFLRAELGFQVGDGTIDILGAVVISLLIIIISIYLLLSGRIDRGDLKNKTKTLELEYRIAELEEKLNQGK